MKVAPQLIQKILGEESISNSVIVLSEIIKNAYESKASEITIDLSNTDHIKIQDNGSGLNKKDFFEAWNVIGDSAKSNDPNALGGKGIGRFTLFYIADVIQVYTKTKKSDSTYFLELDSHALSQANDLNEYNLAVEEANIDFPYESGTMYYLYDLDPEALSYTMIYHDITPILQPFKNYPINIKIIYPKENKEAILRDNRNYHLNHLKPEFAIDYAPFSIEAIFENGEFIEIKYNVKQIYDKKSFITDKVATKKQLEKLNIRILEQSKNSREGINLTKEDYQSLDNIYFNFFNYYFATQSIDSEDKKNIQTKFLNAYKGINIYRGGFKIYGHGREDWLELSAQESQDTRLIYNDIIFGFLELSLTTKQTLREVSSREKLFNNNSYKALKIATNELARFFALEVREKHKGKLLSKEAWENAQKPKAPTDGTSTDGTSTGGASTDGASTGGTSTGGTSTGGTSTGGTSTGGTSTGGTSTGGTSTGGTSTGGTSTGGTSTGGTSTDGTSTDGTSTDGTSTGGTSTDGTSTDGSSTGGTSTDGTSTDGSSTGGTSTDDHSSTGGLTIDKDKRLIKRSILKEGTSISSSLYWNNLINQINNLSQLRRSDYTELITSAIRQVLESYIHLVFTAQPDFPYIPSTHRSLEAKIELVFSYLRENKNKIIQNISTNSDLLSATRSFTTLQNLLTSDYKESNLTSLINKSNVTAHSGSQFTKFSDDEFKQICGVLDFLYLFKITYQ